MSEGDPPPTGGTVNPLLAEKMERALQRLEQAYPYAKGGPRSAVLEVAKRVLLAPGGLDLLYRLAPRLDRAGCFTDTDWDYPSALLPSLVRTTFEQGHRSTVMLEVLSQLRLLAIALGEHQHTGVAPEQARHFLTQVLALNLNRLFSPGGEAERIRSDQLGPGITALFAYLLERVGFDDILTNLVDEIWRILAQRPIQVGPVKAMITQIALTMARQSVEMGEARIGAERLISALFGPTRGTIDDPGLAAYHQRLAAMDRVALEHEAQGFARAMHDVGLVSDYHPVFLRWLLDHDEQRLLPAALGLSSTGLDAFNSYQALVYALVREALHPQTSQAVYGLSLLLERGILYAPPLAAGLWRQIALRLCDEARQAIALAYGDGLPPRIHLLAAVLSLLGQPLGLGQGNNPTCQSARALSMWSYSDPDYLLHLVAQAANDGAITMHFEGQPIVSSQIDVGFPLAPPVDTDAVSMLLVPHLDRIYHQMGRLCVGRGEDPHRWINPELHGWWVGRTFRIAVEIATGALKDYDHFIERFHATYHPFYNGNQPLIHPQPAGLAVTDSSARFVGWHAITIQRVALDQHGEMRVYFFNPNNDSGQNWGNGVLVSTSGHGERFGESSLPFAQLCSRLYIYHEDPNTGEATTPVPAEAIATVQELATSSWAADRLPPTQTQAADAGTPPPPQG